MWCRWYLPHNTILQAYYAWWNHCVIEAIIIHSTHWPESMYCNNSCHLALQQSMRENLCCFIVHELHGHMSTSSHKPIDSVTQKTYIVEDCWCGWNALFHSTCTETDVILLLSLINWHHLTQRPQKPTNLRKFHSTVKVVAKMTIFFTVHAQKRAEFYSPVTNQSHINPVRMSDVILLN